MSLPVRQMRNQSWRAPSVETRLTAREMTGVTWHTPVIMQSGSCAEEARRQLYPEQTHSSTHLQSPDHNLPTCDSLRLRLSCFHDSQRRKRIPRMIRTPHRQSRCLKYLRVLAGVLKVRDDGDA